MKLLNLKLLEASPMRKLLSIIRYEFLMQVKSMRFKGLCVLAFFFNFAMYNRGLATLESRPTDSFLSFQMMIFYWLAIIMAGLFSMGRIRKTGMHPILMTRPIPTYFLALGQMLAAFLSLMTLALLYFFPAGFILKLQFDIDFPTIFILYILLFYFAPALIGLLSITIWIRTCFKNNLMALIILGFIFVSMGILANGPLLDVSTPDGAYHNFVPLVSQFSHNYWHRFQMMEDSPHIVFTRKGDWFNLLLSLVYCNVFLVLSCYHLRRTEPQRKVLGTYGRHWYHIPTFVKMVADLKIDPHITWRSHALLIALAAFIIAKTGLPLARPYWQNFLASREVQKRAAANGSAPIDQKRYEPENIPQRLILQIKILRDDQVWTPESLTSNLTFTCNADTSGTLAIIGTFWRWNQTVEEILLEGHRIPFFKKDTHLFIEGREFKSFSDGAPHHLIIHASTRKSVPTDWEYTRYFIPMGYFFVDKKKISRRPPDGQEIWFFPSHPDYLWDTRLTLTVHYPFPPVEAPVPPIKVEKTGRGRNALTTYVFDIPAELNTVSSSVRFTYFGLGRDVFYTLKNSQLKIRFVTEKSREKTLREVMELAEPVLEEFCTMYGISPERTITINLNPWDLREVRKMQVRCIQHSGGGTWWADSLYNSLDSIEHNMLESVFMKDFRGPGIQGEPSIWDIGSFMEPNFTRGLNHHLSMSQKFEPWELKPAASHLDPQRARSLEQGTRTELLENRSIPVFQMLYLVLGHDNWLKMLQRLKSKIHKNFLTPQLLQEAVRETTGDPMDWFFDYWMKSGTGFPSYKIKGYRANMSEGEKEDETVYNVEVDIANLRTGRMPVPVRLITSKEPINDKIWLGPSETATWKVTTKNLPMQVQIDPDQWIMMSPYWNEKMKMWEMVPSMTINVESKSGNPPWRIGTTGKK